MAHHFKVETVPHLNKDGSPSKTKKDHFVSYRGRARSYRLGPFTKKGDAEREIEDRRFDLVEAHLERHPNDQNFRRKHGLN